jgi:hypothetical protein
VLLDADAAGFLAPADPGGVENRGGPSVVETLHLVSDNQKRYKMF